MSKRSIFCAAALLAFTLPAMAALSAVEVYARVSPSVWKVVIFDANDKPLGLGSAVVVAPEVLVTNCHVVDKAKRVQVRRDGGTLEAEVDLWDRERDLCQLKVRGLVAPAVVIRESSQVLVGQNVYAIGNPRGFELTMSSGLVSAIRRDANGQIERLQTSAAISGGSSGGGLFDDEARLLGLTTSGFTGDTQNLNFAIPADWIKDLWQRHARVYPGAGATDAPAVVAAAPSPASPPAMAPAAPVQAGVAPRIDGVWRAGDELEYSIVDIFTGQRRRAVYRVDRVDGNEVVFNGGDRTETLDGRVLRIATPIGGDMDLLSPPGGWTRGNLAPGVRWSVKYDGNDAAYKSSHRLDATVLGPASITTAAGDFEAVVVAYQGWTRKQMVATTIEQKVDIRVWYAPRLKRVVRFQSDVRPSTNGLYQYTASKESTELTRIRRQ